MARIIPFRRRNRRSLKERLGLKSLVAPLLVGALIGAYIAAMPPEAEPEGVSGIYFVRCGGPPHYNCVIDGDTFYLRDESIRIADIDTPEIGEPQCAAELALGQEATTRLQQLLNAGPFEVVATERTDRDQYDRLLRTVIRDGESIGDILVAEGLARNGPRRSWC